jgi:hypothetical protein
MEPGQLALRRLGVARPSARNMARRGRRGSRERQVKENE